MFSYVPDKIIKTDMTISLAIILFQQPLSNNIGKQSKSDQIPHIDFIRSIIKDREYQSIHKQTNKHTALD